MKTNCAVFVLFFVFLCPFFCEGQTVTPGFTIPDSVCVNTPVSITNASIGASSYYWNFCVADINTPPQGTNLGNVGGTFSGPVFFDYVFDGTNYFGFQTNNWSGNLVRLDFGNSLLNAPVATTLSLSGGTIPKETEGIQVVYNEGKWYAIIVGGDPVTFGSSIAKVEFGTNIANNNPVVTNWGNLGNLNYPHDLYLFQDNGNWYGFTVNARNNTITRFNFSSSFSSVPGAVNLGNLINLDYPTGICAIKENNIWYAFVTSATNSTLTRLNFGNSLLNTPAAQNLGNINGTFKKCWDIQILKYCQQNVGFIINAETGEFLKLDFGSSITNTPTVSSYGNIGNLSFPHCLSRMFRVGADLYTFISNVNNGTLSRIKFTGCTNSSIPSSTAQNPPQVTYSAPGVYNVNLTIDDGLPTQAAICKQVVVVAPPTSTTLNVSTCSGNSISLNPTVTGATAFSWSPTTGLSNSNIQNPIASVGATTQYTLTASNVPGCSSNSDVTVNVLTPQQCQGILPSFTSPDTVCVNTPVNITNTTTGASSYYWNFCVADVNIPPSGVNLGNPGNYLSQPVFCDLEEDNGNYYGFVVNHGPGGITRLDFGNSLLNTPVPVFLGNISGVMNAGNGSEGMQVIKNNGQWYGILVGGSPASGSTPKLITIYFGTNLNNPTPTAISWGNVGNMLQPIDLHVFMENGNWYGLTVNAESNTITRFSFTNDFNNAPSGVNLGNIGNLSYPTGVYALNDNGNWHVFITNQNSNSVSRLDFGNSLLNNPTGINLGNPNNAINKPRDITILKYCGQMVGFIDNGSGSVVRLNFSGVTSTPTAIDLGNLGNLSFPHSLSKLFREGNDIYSLITNVNNNTITRLKFTGCTNSNLPSSTLQSPLPITYSAPGTYNINLSIDDGLPTQNSTCKQVVVLVPPTHSPTQNLSICPGGTIKIGSAIKPGTYQWSTGATTDSISVTTAGTYWVESDRYGCSVRDSFIVTLNSDPKTEVYNSDTTIFAGDLVQLNSYSPSGSYSWLPASNLNCTSCSHPIASPLVSTMYILSGSNACGASKDSVRITVINRTTSQCYNLTSAIGTPFFDRAYDVAPSLNNEFFVAGVTKVNGNDDILISKMDLDGTLIWSKTFGGPAGESVRKISATSDGGVLVTGQTKSYGNSNGDILCFKVSNSGILAWSRKFGVGSANGDLGMDIIETTDGGYVLSGILNVAGNVADGTIIKMDNNANVIWTKRFDNGLGEDGVGVVQKGDTLIVATDIETASGNYSFVITKLKLTDGTFFSSKKMTPAARGLFNPYLYKNPAAPGYIISGHTIDLINYANMQHTIITIDESLNIVNTKLVSINPVTNDFFTGFVPLADGSFIGSASPQSNADGYVYRIASNNTVMYAKKFNGFSDRRLYRLATTGQDAIAVGGTIANGQEDFFVTKFKTDGTVGFNCEVQDAAINVQQPSYTVSNFIWPTITNISFANTAAAINDPSVSLTKNDICLRPQPDFAFQQDICSPMSVQFSSKISGVQSFSWSFGDGQINNNSLTPLITYINYGTYPVKLVVQYATGCMDSISKSITIENLFDNTILLNSDTTICLGDSVLMKTVNSISTFCWKSSSGTAPTILNANVKPSVSTTYVLTSQVVGANLVNNPDFSFGSTGFTSEYFYTTSNNTEGQYWVGTIPTPWNPYMSSCYDHTSGNGNMMMINGSPTAGVKVWSQSFSVKPNTNYNFSVWISSLHVNNPAKLHFAINNVEVGNDINAGSSTCQWKRFFSTWNSGSSTSATISIVNNNTIIDGNDFALDDIFFGEVTTRTDSVHVNVVGLCDSVKINGADKICSSSDTLTYSIYKSANCTQQYSMQVDNAYADIVSQTPTSLKLLFKKNGTATIKVAYANNCKIVADSLNVSIKFSPTSIQFGPDIITCRDTSLILNAGDGFISYTWQDGSKDSTFMINVPGNYTVAAQNLCGLQLKDTIQFVKSFVTPFTVFPSSATVCKGDSIQFKANGGSSYSWSPAGNFSRPDAATTKALVNATQDFSVYISDPVCQRDTTFVIPIVASPGANISVAKSNDVNCSNDSATLIAEGGVSYTWSPNQYISRNNGNRITVKPYQNTTYTVRGKDELGCTGQDSITVFFIKTGDQKLFVPTAFTPNNDGKNDVFRPIFIGPSVKYDFRIYNRWGQLMYKSSVPGAGWDGTVSSIIQKTDVYVFYITVEGGCNGKFEQKGTFALIR